MQQLIQGDKSYLKIPGLIISKGYSKIFIISGQHFLEKHQLDFPQHCTVYHWIKKGMNVEELEINGVLRQFEESNSEVVVAIGGGSVLDLAKSILYKKIAASQQVPFFIAVPTTAGSGSEATHFAVIYKGTKKESWVHPELLPALVVLDASLTFSLSPYQTAISGMDVLSQAVESWWNKNATDESKRYASEAIALWKRSFLPAVQHEKGMAREDMLQAAHLAGKAINITRTTGPHALSYFLTANYKVPHGHAVGLLLPLFFLYNDPQEELCVLLGVKDVVAAKAMIQSAMKQAGLAITLAELGIDKNEVAESLVNEVNEERFANNPAPFDKDRLKQLLLTYL